MVSDFRKPFTAPPVIFGVAFLLGAGTTYNPFSASTALVTSGIYQHTRNPGYLGLAVIQLGLALMIDSVWIVLSVVVATMVTSQFVIKLEEEKLTRTFGREYEDYLGKVRRWILRNPKVSFE